MTQTQNKFIIHHLPGQRFGPTIGAVKFLVHSPANFVDTANDTDEDNPELGTHDIERVLLPIAAGSIVLAPRPTL